MFRITWVFTIAFGLILSLATSFAQEGTKPAFESQPVAEPRQGQSASGTNNIGTQKKQPAPSFVTALDRIEAAIRDLIAEEDKIERQRKKDQEIRDLNAQEEMALWAEGMFYATLATVIVTLMGLALIGRTLHHTKRAANYTEDMALDTATQIEISRKVESDRLKDQALGSQPVIDLFIQVKSFDIVEGEARLILTAQPWADGIYQAEEVRKSAKMFLVTSPDWTITDIMLPEVGKLEAFGARGVIVSSGGVQLSAEQIELVVKDGSTDYQKQPAVQSCRWAVLLTLDYTWGSKSVGVRKTWRYDFDLVNRGCEPIDLSGALEVEQDIASPTVINSESYEKKYHRAPHGPAP